ncbi:MAG: lysostaphin resistance A-like protein [Bacteroidales bacterium]
MKRLISPFLKDKPQFLQFLVFLFFAVGFVLIFMALGAVVTTVLGIDAGLDGGTPGPEHRAGLIIFQLASQLGLFIAPVLLFAVFVSESPRKYLGLKKPTHLSKIGIAVITMIVSLPLIGWLGGINSQMHLPESMSGIEEWMRNSEESAAKTINMILNVKTFGAFLVNLLIVAIIPGIGEELVFRGIIQKMLLKWSKNTHLAVWLTAIVFSAIHMQFFGFLPRLFLGAILGYIFVYSGSLWVSMLCHFFNNALVVVVIYFSNVRGVEDPAKSAEIDFNNYVVVISVFVIIFLLRYLKKGSVPGRK